MFINTKSTIIAFIAIIVTCNAGYQRPIEIQETQNFEIYPRDEGYRKPYNYVPQEIPPSSPSTYNVPQVPSVEGTFNSPPLPSEGTFNSQPQVEMGQNSYMSSNIGFINPGSMPYRSMGGYYRG